MAKMDTIQEAAWSDPPFTVVVPVSYFPPQVDSWRISIPSAASCVHYYSAGRAISPFFMTLERDEASARMGDLLLRGWTMLADACDTCYTPLMEDRHSGERVCVKCGDGGASDAKGEADVEGILTPPEVRGVTRDERPPCRGGQKRGGTRTIFGVGGILDGVFCFDIIVCECDLSRMLLTCYHTILRPHFSRPP